ncbi:3-oxoacyl-ACP synthase III family protein [Promicromonospora thailandica]|uniref:3-oxoacyl-[acyl-carrier-protein] synthase-3 n=1 Tax=Promicromonospora thailandica TaxID=765201 RepID=A0A9X2G7V3_9MICO|nr:ketoacyl-ACP synthase III [Promicromonospora thailandica]MCP2267353.1 3-oxoacyl-[acyl-carrier-protein] synthase-3 [Promicromonospora thailandica]BFF20780.1 ketoacyl-ACP synthase III [Promicromonospora thailandica]
MLPEPAVAPPLATVRPARVAGPAVRRPAPRPVARIAGVAVHLPERTRDVAAAERDLHRRNPGVAPRVPMVSRLTGVRTVHVADDDQQASDLAVVAARTVLADAGLEPRDVDLLVFASATQDMIEPATSHIVAAKLGVTAPVMDVKNACNSVLNGIEVAEALIGTGRYGRVLVASGEMPTRGVRWDVPDRRTYALSAPGYTMSDAGAAVLVQGTGTGTGTGTATARTDTGMAGLEDELAAELAVLADPAEAPSGILGSAFAAESRHWDVGMLPAGGTVNPRDPERSYFEIDGSRLREAFLAIGPGPVGEALERAGVTMDDVALIAVHQVAVGYLADVHEALGVPADRTIVTVADHGNIASATLPLQLVTAQESGRLRRGDVVLLLGLAGGISMGAMVVRW